MKNVDTSRPFSRARIDLEGVEIDWSPFPLVDCAKVSYSVRPSRPPSVVLHSQI
jgi:hypothetical protein